MVQVGVSCSLKLWKNIIFIILYCLVNGQESKDMLQISVSGNFWSNSMCLIVNLMIMIVQIGVSG